MRPMIVDRHDGHADGDGGVGGVAGGDACMLSISASWFDFVAVPYVNVIHCSMAGC